MQQISIKGMQELAQMRGEYDPLGIVQETRISPLGQMLNAQTTGCP